jgi:4-hydroxy-tetrahydrodipicolinate synthase
MQNGGDGYCGIMCNYHPRLYAWLAANYEKEREKAGLVQSVLGTFGFTEVGIPYPLSAKYHMTLCGMETNLITRNPACRALTDYDKSCVEQMKKATDFLEKYLGI